MQPLAFPYKTYQKDREVATKAVGGIVPLFTNLERLKQAVTQGARDLLFLVLDVGKIK